MAETATATAPGTGLGEAGRPLTETGDITNQEADLVSEAETAGEPAEQALTPEEQQKRELAGQRVEQIKAWAEKVKQGDQLRINELIGLQQRKGRELSAKWYAQKWRKISGALGNVALSGAVGAAVRKSMIAIVGIQGLPLAVLGGAAAGATTGVVRELYRRGRETLSGQELMADLQRYLEFENDAQASQLLESIDTHLKGRENARALVFRAAKRGAVTGAIGGALGYGIMSWIQSHFGGGEVAAASSTEQAAPTAPAEAAPAPEKAGFSFKDYFESLKDKGLNPSTESYVIQGGGGELALSDANVDKIAEAAVKSSDWNALVEAASIGDKSGVYFNLAEHGVSATQVIDGRQVGEYAIMLGDKLKDETIAKGFYEFLSHHQNVDQVVDFSKMSADQFSSMLETWGKNPVDFHHMFNITMPVGGEAAAAPGVPEAPAAPGGPEAPAPGAAEVPPGVPEGGVDEPAVTPSETLPPKIEANRLRTFIDGLMAAEVVLATGLTSIVIRRMYKHSRESLGGEPLKSDQFEQTPESLLHTQGLDENLKRVETTGEPSLVGVEQRIRGQLEDGRLLRVGKRVYGKEEVGAFGVEQRKGKYVAYFLNEKTDRRIYLTPGKVEIIDAKQLEQEAPAPETAEAPPENELSNQIEKWRTNPDDKRFLEVAGGRYKQNEVEDFGVSDDGQGNMVPTLKLQGAVQVKFIAGKPDQEITFFDAQEYKKRADRRPKVPPEPSNGSANIAEELQALNI